jgi:hypothetical protein
MVSPHVEPVGFYRTADGAIIAEVRHSVRDLEGNLRGAVCLKAGCPRHSNIFSG